MMTAKHHLTDIKEVALAQFTTGWAHVDRAGNINVSTVHGHARGAKVNALHAVYQITPKSFWTDDLIAAVYAECATKDGGRVTEVFIAQVLA